ncbi:MAG TPA: L,D-transpeptidase family protein [Acidimicrobiia bacterium]|nr:L,D-transpeptidase family protein [Acidimicrobiia bacterium]
MLRRLTHLALTISLVFGFVAWAPPDAEASTSVANLQSRLKAKGFYRGSVDGIAGAQTQQAIMAFRKEVGATRSFSWSSSLDGLLRDYVRPWLPYRLGEPDRVEVNLTRQVMYLIRGNEVQQVFPISSGNGEPYTNSFGKFTNARTPTGDFKIQRHVRGERISYLGFLWNPWYFTGGYALHGSSSVPAYPASHGCVRLTMWDSDWLENQLWIGMPVHVWYEPSGVRPVFSTNGLGIGGSTGCASGNCDSIAFGDGRGNYYLWNQINHQPSIEKLAYGAGTDLPVFGDWDGDGVDTPGIFRAGAFHLRHSATPGPADLTFYFGRAGDIPFAGDFNGDGLDSVGIFRPSEQRFFVLDQLPGNGESVKFPDHSFVFGRVGDKPFVGDFDGNGTDSIGLHRPSTGEVFMRNTISAGWADLSFIYGRAGDQLVAGDWNGDGRDTVAVYRPSWGVLFIKNKNSAGNADGTFDVGFLKNVSSLSK